MTNAASTKGSTAMMASRLAADREPRFQKRYCSSTILLESSRKLESPPKVAESATPTRISLRGLERPIIMPSPSTITLPSSAPRPAQSR